MHVQALELLDPSYVKRRLAFGLPHVVDILLVSQAGQAFGLALTSKKKKKKLRARASLSRFGRRSERNGTTTRWHRMLQPHSYGSLLCILSSNTLRKQKAIQ
jgi:hypothetical protein